MGYMVREYMQRQVLAKIGVTDDLNGVTDFKAECFTVVASELASQQEREAKKKPRKR